MKISMNAYEQVMSQAADKMTELYDKVKRQDDELATLREQIAEARELISEAKIEIGFAIYGNTQPSTSVYDKLTAYLQKVKSA